MIKTKHLLTKLALIKKSIKTTLCLLCLCAPTILTASPYQAARDGDLEALRNYRFNSINLYVPDERGFIPYELAALYADPDNKDEQKKRVEVMLWLKGYNADKHKYGEASIKLVQTALNHLGYQAGTPDGFLGKNTKQAILDYQKDNQLSETGNLGPQWLGSLYRDIVFQMQTDLNALGYKVGKPDGIIGKNTITAMHQFRQDKQLENPSYDGVDALIINRLNEINTQAKVEKQVADKSDKSTVMFAQAALNLLNYSAGTIDGVMGQKTKSALTQYQKDKKLPQGSINNQTIEQLNKDIVRSVQVVLNQAGYNTGKPDGKIGRKTKQSISLYKKNNQIRGGDQIDLNLLIALNSPKKAPTSNIKTEKKVITHSLDTTQATVSSFVGTKVFKGEMIFSGNGNNINSCSINGQSISLEWCEPFYPLPKNNYCEASIKDGSQVINLWCK